MLIYVPQCPIVHVTNKQQRNLEVISVDSSAHNHVDNGHNQQDAERNEAENHADIVLLVGFAGGIGLLILEAKHQTYNTTDNAGNAAKATTQAAKTQVNDDSHDTKDKDSSRTSLGCSRSGIIAGIGIIAIVGSSNRGGIVCCTGSSLRNHSTAVGTEPSVTSLNKYE